MGWASPVISAALRRRTLVATSLSGLLAAGVLLLGLVGSEPVSATACGQPLCATLTMQPAGNGTGEIATTTSAGVIDHAIECLRQGGITSGTCSRSYPLHATVYFRIIAATGSKAICSGLGCTTTGVKSVTLSGNVTVSVFGFALLDPVKITLSVTGTGAGGVTSNPRGIDCGGTNTACAV